jgi:hypothetical protein
MNCTVEKRSRARKCAETLDARQSVLAVDVLDPHTDPSDRWTIELVLCENYNGVPPQILDDLGSYRATLRKASPQGPYYKAVVTF